MLGTITRRDGATAWAGILAQAGDYIVIDGARLLVDSVAESDHPEAHPADAWVEIPGLGTFYYEGESGYVLIPGRGSFRLVGGPDNESLGWG